MPFIDPSIRLPLGLVESCPSDEAIQQAAIRHGLSWDGVQLSPLPPAPAPQKKPSSAKGVKKANG